MFKPTCFGISIALFFCCPISNAQSIMNKCTDGKQITYTDKTCEKLGLKDAGAINKDTVTIVPATTNSQFPQKKAREEVPPNKVQEEAPQVNNVYQCTTLNGIVSYSSNPCPKSSLLPQGFYAPVQQEAISQSEACEKISANRDANPNSNLSCPQK